MLVINVIKPQLADSQKMGFSRNQISKTQTAANLKPGASDKIIVKFKQI